MGPEWMVKWEDDQDLSWDYLRDMDALLSQDPNDYDMLQCGLYRWNPETQRFDYEDGIGGVLYDYSTELFRGETFRLDEPRFESYQAEIVADLLRGVRS